eukprot:2030885-Rhodomonas_salina.1
MQAHVLGGWERMLPCQPHDHTSVRRHHLICTSSRLAHAAVRTILPRSVDAIAGRCFRWS